MNSSQNFKGTTQPYNFYFPDKMNASIERNDSRISSISSVKLSNSNVVSKEDEIVQNGVQKRLLGRQISLDSAGENEFMVGFEDRIKNMPISTLNNQSNVFHAIDRKKEQKLTIVSHLQQGSSRVSQNQADNSFLLDSQTYKNICYQQYTKKSQLANLLDSTSLNSCLNRCELHDSAFQIVCIEDKSLICSHCAIFGDHKTHSLAPLKKIDEFIKLKRQQVSDIIADYKSLQLGIKQKAFMSEFSGKLLMKKKQISSSIMQSFNQMREFLNLYQNQLIDQLQKLYSCLQGNINDAIKRISLDSNRAAFERWQQDALSVVEQLGYREMTKTSQISLFLSNFQIPAEISNCTQSKQSLQTVSLQEQGKHYLNQIEQQLNLNINQVMKISNKFKLNFDTDFKQKIKSMFSFQTDSQLQTLIQQNKLTTILGQLKNINANNNNNSSHQSPTKIIRNNKNLLGIKTSNSNIKNITASDHIRNSFSHFNKPVTNRHKQTQLASTVNSITQSVPFFNMVKNKKLSSPKNGHNDSKNEITSVQCQDLSSTTGNLPLKFKKREMAFGNEEARRTEKSVKSIDLPFNLTESKSFCLDTERKKRISPSSRNMVKVHKDHLFVSPSTTRLNRCSSRQPASIYSPTIQKQRQSYKDLKLKTEQSEVEDPLKIIEHYQQTQTQTFDLSNCDLNDTEVIYFVQKASKIRKIKHLKLTGNQLTDSGLQKTLNYLPNCNLMNLSNNKLSQNSIDILLKKREKILQLKLVNLANNKLNERKIKQKISEFKRMGIVVTL